jgi:hypothetical protein
MKIKLMLRIFSPCESSMVIQRPEQCDGERTQKQETSQHHHQHVLKPVGACPFIFIFIVASKTGERAVVRFEVFTMVTMKNADFWDVTPCGYCEN